MDLNGKIDLRQASWRPNPIVEGYSVAEILEKCRVIDLSEKLTPGREKRRLANRRKPNADTGV